MNDAQNLDPVGEWKVENKNSFKAVYAKDSQHLQAGML